MKAKRMYVVAAAVGLMGVGVLPPGVALASPPSGFTPTILFQADFGRADVMVQRIVIDPGGTSGWHHHPGVVTVVVTSGSVTVLDSDCNRTRYGPGLPNGAVFTESGDEPGEVTSPGGATLLGRFVVPSADPPVFRIEDDPPPCA